MEVLAMLKHWRGGGGGGATRAPPVAPPNATTTLASSALRPSTETEDDDDDDDGPFFDLEFFVPDDGGESDGSSPESEQGYERGLKLTVGAGAGFRGGSLRSDPGLSLSPSPSDDLFFKGRVLPLDPASLIFASPKPSSRPKSGTKLRVFLLGFKKHKTGTAESDPKQQQEQQRRRQGRFFVKFKAEDVPIVSLFTRDNSSRSRPAKLHPDVSSSSPGSEKRFSKDALHRYLTKIKRYAERQHFNGKLSSTGSDVAGTKQSPSTPSNPKCQRPLGLREVCSRLGKSRSASSSVAAVRSPPILPPERRRDDSLLELQDGIQSAIAHCKRSFNAGTESSLVRCWSDPGDERSAPVRASASASSTVRSNF